LTVSRCLMKPIICERPILL